MNIQMKKRLPNIQAQRRLYGLVDQVLQVDLELQTKNRTHVLTALTLQSPSVLQGDLVWYFSFHFYPNYKIYNENKGEKNAWNKTLGNSFLFPEQCLLHLAAPSRHRGELTFSSWCASYLFAYYCSSRTSLDPLSSDRIFAIAPIFFLFHSIQYSAHRLPFTGHVSTETLR